MNGLYCRTIRTTLIARLLDTGEIPSLFEPHVTACLRCQAVVAHTRRLRRTLAGLRPPFPSLEEERSSSSLGWVAALASVAVLAVVVRLRQQTG